MYVYMQPVAGHLRGESILAILCQNCGLCVQYEQLHCVPVCRCPSVHFVVCLRLTRPLHAAIRYYRYSCCL